MCHFLEALKSADVLNVHTSLKEFGNTMQVMNIMQPQSQNIGYQSHPQENNTFAHESVNPNSARIFPWIHFSIHSESITSTVSSLQAGINQVEPLIIMRSNC